MTSLFITLLIIVDVVICLLAVLLVMMQRPSQEGLGAAFGGGVTDQMFGAQTTNVLQRGTVYMTIAFFVVNLLLSVLIARSGSKDENLGSGLKALSTSDVEGVEKREGATASTTESVESNEGTADKAVSQGVPSNALPVPQPIATSSKTVEASASSAATAVETLTQNAEEAVKSVKEGAESAVDAVKAVDTEAAKDATKQ